MANPTSKEIISTYLYGTKTPPENLVSEGLIRPEAALVTLGLDREAWAGGGVHSARPYRPR